MAKHAESELEQAINQLKRENNKENLNHLMDIMQKSNLYIPATLPPDTDPALMKQIAESNGQEQPLPQGVNPRPGILENKEGERFLPLFSSEEQAVKNDQIHPLLLSLPFSTCMDLIANEENMAGIVINAFDQNIILHTNVTHNQQEQKKEIQVTEDQLHIILRQQVEAGTLPKALFEQGADFLNAFKEEAASILLDIYRQLYPKEVSCPYTEEDFDLMTLNISEELTILQLRTPSEHSGIGTCPMILIMEKPQEQTIRYFGIVRGKQGEANHIYEALPDDTKKDLGEAPAEGSELQYIIDLHEREHNS